MSHLPADTPAYLRALASHAGIQTESLPLPVEGRVRVNGLSLRYLDWGDRAAPAIVLLHGGGQSARTWDACCLVLARRHRCLALDQRGHGDSDWSPEAAYGFEHHADDIGGFIEALGLPAPILVGMSMGGINAIACAAHDPRRLRALVIVDVAPEVQFEPVERMMQGMAAYRRFASPREAAERLARLGARRDPALLEATLALNLRAEADGGWTWKYDPRTLAELSAKTPRAAPTALGRPVPHQLPGAGGARGPERDPERSRRCTTRSTSAARCARHRGERAPFGADGQSGRARRCHRAVLRRPATWRAEP